MTSLSSPKLFRVRQAVRYHTYEDDDKDRPYEYHPPKPPYGALISYYLPAIGIRSDIVLEILNKHASVIQKISIPSSPGVHRVAWALDAIADPDNESAPAVPVVPGVYRARLRIGNNEFETPIDVVLDPLLSTSLDEYASQYDALLRIARLKSQSDKLLAMAKTSSGPPSKPKPAGETASISPIRSNVAWIIQDIEGRDSTTSSSESSVPIEAALETLRRQVLAGERAPTATQVQWIELIQRRLSEDAARLSTPSQGVGPSPKN